MKAREKRRRRALRQQRKRREDALAEYWLDCVSNGRVLPWPRAWPGPVAWNCDECDPDLPCYGQLVHCIRYVPETA